MRSRLLLSTLGLTLLVGVGLGVWELNRVQPAPSAPAPTVSTSPEPQGAAAPALSRPEVIFPAPRPPQVVVSVPLPDTFPLHESVPVQLSQVQMGRVQVVLLRGGQPVSRHVLWRSSVGEFIREVGAVAGVNGTFFKDAAIASNDSNMLGPMLTPDGHFLSETDPVQLKKIGGRPLVAWSHDRFLVTDFDPASMNHKAQVQALLPGMTDAFLAGGWLVHGGQALSMAAMMRHAPKDAQEVRPRVFFGVTGKGLVIAGATTTPVSSARLAQVAQQAGAQEAVLMDSGYSTSLIYGSRVLAVGHRTRKVPSRPVPHAIVFMNPVLAVVKAVKP
ncbi:phosphodiester glycosidase family protein [Deinococcus sp. UYEF24]